MIKGKINQDKLLSFFSAVPLHPNHITLLSVLIAIIAFAIFQYNQLYSIILFAISFFIDAVDGVVARAKNLASKKGAFLDGISDRLVEFLIILTIMYYFSSNQIILLSSICILFFGTCMTSYVKAYAHHQGLLNEKEAKKLPGILERAERVILLFLILASLVYFQQYSIYLIVLTAILSVITFTQRIYLILKK
ncbi:MAG: CDP-alcohol phosphatidyltransferase family protein [Candidatus Micrarchaeia archaeon]